MEKAITSTEQRIQKGETFIKGVIVYTKKNFSPTHLNDSDVGLAQITTDNGTKVWIYTKKINNGYQVCSNPNPGAWKKISN